MTKKIDSVNTLAKNYKQEFCNEESIKEALLKKAKGFLIKEITEEYSQDEEDKRLKLIKRKVCVKEVAPDLSAIKSIIEIESMNKSDFKNMTTEELIEERDRLLKLLKEGDETEDESE